MYSGPTASNIQGQRKGVECGYPGPHPVSRNRDTFKFSIQRVPAQRRTLTISHTPPGTRIVSMRMIMMDAREYLQPSQSSIVSSPCEADERRVCHMIFYTASAHSYVTNSVPRSLTRLFFFFFFGIQFYILHVYLRHRSGHPKVVLSKNIEVGRTCTAV